MLMQSQRIGVRCFLMIPVRKKKSKRV